MSNSNSEQKSPGKPKGKHGGARPGSGAKGTSLARTMATQSFRQRYPMYPLEFFMGILNAPDPDFSVPKLTREASKNIEMVKEHAKLVENMNTLKLAALHFKMEAARQAAPYIHARLPANGSSPDAPGADAPSTRQTIDMTKLTTEELQLLERMIMKSQITVPVGGDDE